MGGLGHDFKAGVNFINEPRLFITFNVGKGGYAYQHLDNNVNGPISQVTLQGGAAEANIPTKQFAVYFQDDWRVTDRLTLNLGLRYDLITGLRDRSVAEPELRDGARAPAARVSSAGSPGSRTSARMPKEDYNNFQPRIGFAYDVARQRQGRRPRRVGASTIDFGYTNSNILFAAVNATGRGAGTVFEVNNAGGIRNPDGSSSRVRRSGQQHPGQNQAGGALPLNRPVASPRHPAAVHRSDLGRLVARVRLPRR